MRLAQLALLALLLAATGCALPQTYYRPPPAPVSSAAPAWSPPPPPDPAPPAAGKPAGPAGPAAPGPGVAPAQAGDWEE